MATDPTNPADTLSDTGDSDVMLRDLELGRGVYDADRAAALAGVPKSTLHRWARTGLYPPSISPGPRVRLWSWADLLALRALDWLRRRREHQEGAESGEATDRDNELPHVTMHKIRLALEQLVQRGIPRQRLTEVLVASPAGDLYFQFPGEPTVRAAPGQQAVLPDLLVFVRPYAGAPDLLRPRPLLRIIPGKLHGEPHIVNTRISSAALYALEEAGYTQEQIQRMYPDLPPQALIEALDLEHSLRAQWTRAA